MTPEKLIFILSIVTLFILIVLPSAFIPKGANPYDAGYATGKFIGAFLKNGFLIFSLGYFIYRYGIRKRPL